MLETMRKITKLFEGIENDFRRLGLFGWILMPVLTILTLLIFLLGGIIAFITLLDLFFQFLIDTFIRRRKNG